MNTELLSLLQLIFWVGAAWVVYVYAGYPVILAVLARLRPRPVHKQDWRPRVTVVTAARNEAAHIAATINNKLAQNYPAELLDIIVVSDESDDGTDEIVRSFAGSHVSLVRQQPRAGKTAALNRVVPSARGEIIVFSDANSMYGPETIAALVSNFADPAVGYVTGRMVFGGSGSLAEEGSGTYVRYENWIRENETQLGSIVGADGGVDAVRRDWYQPMANDQQPDFVQPLSIVMRGRRVVYEPDAVVHEEALNSGGDEYRMRVRVTLRAMWAIHAMRRLLNPFKFGLFSWQLASHKILRYLAFIPLVAVAATSVMLWSHGWLYQFAVMGQVVVYTLGWLAMAIPALSRHRVVALPGYFVTLNLACAHAFLRFSRGQRQALWAPRVG